MPTYQQCDQFKICVFGIAGELCMAGHACSYLRLNTEPSYLPYTLHAKCLQTSKPITFFIDTCHTTNHANISKRLYACGAAELGRSQADFQPFQVQNGDDSSGAGCRLQQTGTLCF